MAKFANTGSCPNAVITATRRYLRVRPWFSGRFQKLCFPTNLSDMSPVGRTQDSGGRHGVEGGISKNQGVFPGNPSYQSLWTSPRADPLKTHQQTNTVYRQIPAALGRTEAGVGSGGQAGGREGEGQVLGKRIMLYFLLLPDFQKERPRFVHKMHTLKWIRLRRQHLRRLTLTGWS